MPRPYKPLSMPRQVRNGIEIENIWSRGYSADQIDCCLMLIARFQNYAMVSQLVLDQFGWEIAPTMLADWKSRQYAARYQSLLVEMQPELEATALRNYSDAVTKLQSAQDKAIDKVVDALDDPRMEPKDASGALRNVSIALGVNTDKGLLMSGRPTVIVERKGSDEILRNLAGRGFVKVQPELVEGSVIEEGDAA